MTLTKSRMCSTIFIFTIAVFLGACAKKDSPVASFGAVYSANTSGSARLPITTGSTVAPVVVAASDENADIHEPLFRVYFSFDISHLDAVSRATLDATVKWFASKPSDSKLVIEGNCDERGTREYNLALGQRRSDAVRTYLVSSGVNAARIDTISFGEERPICGERNEVCWSHNRRADIVIR